MIIVASKPGKTAAEKSARSAPVEAQEAQEQASAMEVEQKPARQTKRQEQAVKAQRSKKA